MSLLIRGGDFNCGERAEAVACQVAPRCSSCGGGEDSKMTGETLKNGALQCPSTGRGLKHGLHRESLLSYIAPHTRSGDFNRHSNCRRFQFSVAPHTESGNFNLICPGKTLESGRHFPHGKWGFQRHTRHCPNSQAPSLPTREVGISTGGRW